MLNTTNNVFKISFLYNGITKHCLSYHLSKALTKYDAVSYICGYMELQISTYTHV